MPVDTILESSILQPPSETNKEKKPPVSAGETLSIPLLEVDKKASTLPVLLSPSALQEDTGIPTAMVPLPEDISEPQEEPAPLKTPKIRMSDFISRYLELKEPAEQEDYVDVLLEYHTEGHIKLDPKTRGVIEGKKLRLALHRLGIFKIIHTSPATEDDSLEGPVVAPVRGESRMTPLSAEGAGPIAAGR